jgi:hypothetical protein
MIIRKAAVDDLPRLEALTQEFSSASKHIRGFHFDRFCDVWTTLLPSETGVVYLLCEGPAIYGLLGGVIYPDIYSRDLVATEFFWFVTSKHRGRGLELYCAFEAWAREKGARYIRMAYLCDLMPEGMKFLYEELGFEAIEVSYGKELP